MTARAADRLIEAGAASLLYLGDVCDESVVRALADRAHAAGQAIPVRLVFGNMDAGLEDRLAATAHRLGLSVDHPVGRYRACERAIVAHHGHLRGVEEQAAEAEADYYLHGHTHRERDERLGGMRIINPGALHRASRYTVALLDPFSDRLETFEIASAR